MQQFAKEGVVASALRPPRFFQLDSGTLQVGLEERIRDVIHGTVSPLVSAPWMEEFRAIVELSVSSACFVLGLVASRSEQSVGYAVNYGDHIYNLRYVVAPYRNTIQHTKLLIRLLIRFVLLNVLPVFSRLLQRRNLQREQQSMLFLVVRQAERALRAFDLLNHVHFLYSGDYRSIVDRMLQIRLASGERELQLSAHTYLIDRQHFWSTVFAAMSLFVPMLNIGSWMRYFGQSIRRLVAATRGMMSGATTGGAGAGGGGGGTPAGSRPGSRPPSGSGHTRDRSGSPTESFECLVCHTEPMAMPRRSRECGHVCICYFCSVTARLDECPQCHAFCSAFVE